MLKVIFFSSGGRSGEEHGCDDVLAGQQGRLPDVRILKTVAGSRFIKNIEDFFQFKLNSSKITKRQFLQYYRKPSFLTIRRHHFDVVFSFNRAKQIKPLMLKFLKFCRSWYGLQGLVKIRSWACTCQALFPIHPYLSKAFLQPSFTIFDCQARYDNWGRLRVAAGPSTL